MRTVGPVFIRAMAGGQPSGDLIEIDCTDMNVIRADITIAQTAANPSDLEFAFQFSCNPNPGGSFFEANSTDRVIVPNIPPSPIPDTWGSEDINCKGFARCRFLCVFGSPLSLDSSGIVRLSAFTTLKRIGRLSF